MTYFLGYGDAQNIANEDGLGVDGEEEVDSEMSEEMGEDFYAGKYLRFFSMEDEDFFALTVECGIDRDISVTPSDDFGSLQLVVKIPIPPDAVIQQAGYHAARVSLEPVDEEFNIPTPRILSRLKEDKPIVYWYPNEKTPLWVTFKFKLEQETKASKIVAPIHLTNLFLSLSKT
jgi:hypothetical protein